MRSRIEACLAFLDVPSAHSVVLHRVAGAPRAGSKYLAYANGLEALLSEPMATALEAHGATRAETVPPPQGAE